MEALIEAIREHPFWAAMTAAVIVWYSTVTIYVAVRGVMDIRGMLERLKASDNPSDLDSLHREQA